MVYMGISCEFFKAIAQHVVPISGGQKAFGKSRKNGFGKNQKSLKKLKKIPENLLTLVFGYATM